MNWPEMYHRRYLRFPDQRLQEIQKELWDAKNIIAKARQENVFTMNSQACFDYHRKCDYWALCCQPGSGNRPSRKVAYFSTRRPTVSWLGPMEGFWPKRPQKPF